MGGKKIVAMTFQKWRGKKFVAIDLWQWHCRNRGEKKIVTMELPK